jgi:hypothetical protein
MTQSFPAVIWVLLQRIVETVVQYGGKDSPESIGVKVHIVGDSGEKVDGKNDS